MKEMALILQGGGALGAFEYGAVTRLVELGWQPKAVTGVSIGAINAAAIAGAVDGDINASLQRMWQAITMPTLPWLPASQQGFLSMFGNPRFYWPRTNYIDMPGWTSLYETKPMCATLEQICDFEQMNNPRHMRIGVTATDLQTGAMTTFSNYLPAAAAGKTDLPLHHVSCVADLNAQHIMASGSLPPGFPAMQFEGRQYWDGGLFSNTPIDALLNMLEPDEVKSLPIFVLDLFPSAGLAPPANLLDVQSRATMLQYQNRFWAQYGGSGDIDAFAKLLDGIDSELPGQSALRERPDYHWLMRLRALRNLEVIQAPVPVMTGASDFSAYGIANACQSGRNAVDEHFARADALSARPLRAVA